MISITQQHDIHADTMAHTSCLHDELIASKSPLTFNPFNSCAPNVWLHDACLSGGMWGPKTEFTESAIAILHSYQFQTRHRMLRYAAIGPKNKRGDDVFCGFLSCETKSLVFESRVIDEANASYYFAELAPKKRKHQNASKDLDLHEDIMKHPSFAYALVSEQDLDDAYAAYLAGDQRADEVANSVLDFVRRKLALGSKEHKLRERGADDLIGQFWQKMHQAILEKSFRGDSGSQFHYFVNAAWARLRTDAYRRLQKDDKLFRSSRQDRPDSDDGDWAAFGYENKHAEALHGLVKQDERSEDAIWAHELKASLTGTDLAIVQLLMEGYSTSQTAQRVCMSRHSVRRVQTKLRKSMQKADRVRNRRVI